MELHPRLLLLLRLLHQLLNTSLVLRVQGVLFLLGGQGADVGVLEAFLIKQESIRQAIVGLPTNNRIVPTMAHKIGTGRLELLGRVIVSTDDALQIPGIALKVIVLHGLPATVIVASRAPADGPLLAFDRQVAQLESDGRHQTRLLNCQQVVFEIVAVLLSQDLLFMAHGQVIEDLLCPHLRAPPHAPALKAAAAKSVAEFLSGQFFEWGGWIRKTRLSLPLVHLLTA